MRRLNAWRRIAPRIGQSLLGGIGGGVGRIGSEALSSASHGAASGGLMGGITGLLGGLGIGALAFGAFKLGQAGAEGYGMANERNLALDTLKRQMGDLGLSFGQLKAMSDAASEGLGVNSKEFAALEQQYTQASHGADRSATVSTDRLLVRESPRSCHLHWKAFDEFCAQASRKNDDRDAACCCDQGAWK